MSETLLLRTAADVELAGAQWAARVQPGEVWALHGPLGAGKTTFVRGLARALGVPTDEVTSPTFGLCHVYRGDRLELVHADLYRVEDPTELDEAGLTELLDDPERLVVVEWPERAGDRLPQRTQHLWLEVTPEGRVLRSASEVPRAPG